MAGSTPCALSRVIAQGVVFNSMRRRQLEVPHLQSSWTMPHIFLHMADFNLYFFPSYKP